MTEILMSYEVQEACLMFEIMESPFVSGRCLPFRTDVVDGLQGMYGLADGDTKELRVPLALRL